MSILLFQSNQHLNKWDRFTACGKIAHKLCHSSLKIINIMIHCPNEQLSDQLDFNKFPFVLNSGNMLRNVFRITFSPCHFIIWRIMTSLYFDRNNFPLDLRMRILDIILRLKTWRVQVYAKFCIERITFQPFQLKLIHWQSSHDRCT